jgi:choline dehydrogenase-like flavoprotein
MIIDSGSLEEGELLQADVAVVGSGPAGITTALELENHGLSVVLIESGRRQFEGETQDLGDAAIEDETRHAPMSMTTRRVLGGASSVWGGRCVPFDPIDFASRPFVDGEWPVNDEELVPLYGRACELFVCGRPAFSVAEMPQLPPSIVPGLEDGDVLSSTFERWSLPTDFGQVYYARLEQSRDLRVVTGLTCTQIVAEPSRQAVSRLVAKTLSGKTVAVKARSYVLACGGLETTRLLLASRDGSGRAIGDHSGHLGRWYMGHLEGSIANVRFTTPPRETIYGYERDIDRVYVRRRISTHPDVQVREQLPNIVCWLANPDLPDASHRDGALSLAYLLLSSPLGRVLSPPAQRAAMTGERVPGVPYGPVKRSPFREHLRNITRDLPGAIGFALDFGPKRFLVRGRRAPGFFVKRSDNVYPLQFHGEHLPSFDSRVSLDDSRDQLDLPRLRIDVRFSDADVDGVVQAHELWDRHLRAQGVGSLEYTDDDRAAAVSSCLGAGFHQSGTTRMSADPADGVLTPDLAVHGFDDLYVASSSAFVTSGQANSTFMIVVFAIRLAQHLRSRLGSRSAG